MKRENPSYFVPMQSDGSLPRPFNHVSANKSEFNVGATKSSYNSVKQYIIC